jgi:hypothetical protein
VVVALKEGPHGGGDDLVLPFTDHGGPAGAADGQGSRDGHAALRFLVSRPEKGQGDFRLPMLTCVLRTRREIAYAESLGKPVRYLSRERSAQPGDGPHE